MATNTKKEEVYDVENNVEETKTGLPLEEEKIIMSQEDLINGLLAASDFQDDEEEMQPIEIRRNGKLFFHFKVRPLSETELTRIRKQSTDYYKNPAGKHLPRLEGDLRLAEYRSRKIYAATCDEDRAKLWDNPQVKAGLKAKGKDILENWEIIDAVMKGGEKYKVSEIIDDISGYNDDEQLELEQYAKN